VLEAEAGETGETGTEPGHGLRVTDGPRREALARLCFQTDDRIVSLNEMGITGVPSAIQAIDEFLSAAADNQDVALAMTVVRAGCRLPVEFRFQPVIRTRTEIDMPREEALAALRLERETLDTNVSTILQVNHDNAKAMGEPVDGPDGLNGLWLLGVKDPKLKEFRSAAGLASGDRIMRIDEVAMTSLAGVRSHLSQLIEQLEQGAISTASFDIERGEFQYLKLIVKVD